MFANSLVFTTLVATLFAVSGVNAGDLSAINTENPVQCQPLTFKWNGNNKGPYNLYVFTDCKDDSDAPIATFTNIDDTSYTWTFPTLLSGDGFFFQVEDSNGGDAFSDDDYFGGDSSKSDDCKAQIAAVKSSPSATATSAIASTTPAPAFGGDNAPTTQSRASSTTIPASGVANAASDPTSGTNNKAASDKVTNSASSLVTRPFELAAGLLAAAAVAFL